MKIELKKEETKGFAIFNVVFEPETVEETLLLKELEQRREDETDYLPSEWDGPKFIVRLT
ncbi:hypothetical protein LCGC14_3024840 [marine sediment metagenome]|uniref:Uncharacterized protein n=1 Tax=marine sediment metagenome TaxID=412755 RepID=A0A0F8WUN3_9ZZZZ